MKEKRLTKMEVVEETGLTLEELEWIQKWLGRKDAREHMGYLKNTVDHGLGFYPSGYDAEAAIISSLEKRGEKGRDWRSVRIGFSIGYQEGFRLAAEYACEMFEALTMEGLVCSNRNKGEREKTEYEVIETKLAELYQLQWERVESLAAKQELRDGSLREEVAEAREILSEWMWCIEAKERAHRRVEAKAKLD